MENALESRLAAFQIIKDVVFYGKTSDDAFTSVRIEHLSESDKQFVRQIVLTTLRHWGQIQHILGCFLSKPLSTKLRDVQLVLSLGVAQMIFLKTPAHAAVDTSVRLVKHIQKVSFSKLVNGVLRNIDRQKESIEMPPATCNLPKWLFESWQKSYGLERTAVIAEKLMIEPDLDITVKGNPLTWAAEWRGIVLETGTVRVSSKEGITTRRGYETGDWWIQEASASIPVQLFPELAGRCVADLCAAPGGKTAQLAARGAVVDAYDISERRLKRLRANMLRLHYNESVRVICGDILKLQLPSHEKYDAVLLDAPCSATGTIRRHPDLLFHRTEDDVVRLSSLQRQLLEKTIDFVKPGGYIVYATCSMQPEENETVIQDVLGRCTVLERVPISEKWQRFKNAFGAIQVLPDQGQDGFYAALLRKKE